MKRRVESRAHGAATRSDRSLPARRRLRASSLFLALSPLLALACSQAERDASPDPAQTDAPVVANAPTAPNAADPAEAQERAGRTDSATPPRVAEAPPAATDLVRLTPTQLDQAGIVIAAAGPGPVDSGIELVGEVHPNGDRLAHITPRFPGIVREVEKRAGDVVHAGDVLAVIESSDSLAPYTVKTAIDGVVIAKDLTRGEAVERSKQAFVVADLSSVWVDLAVYQKDLGRIPMGQRVHIDAVGEGPAAEGTISYITPSVDQVTRTATARVVVANPGRKFLPGMFVTAHTLDRIDAPVTVPLAAIQSIGGQACVFVEVEGGLLRRPVVLGREGTELAEIRSGLAAGERIAVRNSFLLKAELAKAQIAEEG